ncbi:MAG: Flp pilus assembly complex ATPase component TadA [Candidatus Jacksonbacteria bacterium]|jgi:twitching motility protein PilT|nr:Flp pilus assembly complex ATPase component TadA [Candidatus Jacksonbacteria bacterium]MBT6034632.1 Flp pilus assembly complex ATPase component TadA [Candidatus Jacksonbacteria bacterium]MBT6301575.1 Flp pilus assembly complex ATPase component TadA [Candidatus Jacksonbacteria bacterium]MBT6756993.1 Flp pilus assembly complex ATPase component TadA [Candidatus Jacksonbacteria bacterium]MBT6955105.1 Flp pilus assembly complex ATPase component TadA [Candidatus Jacksonbacteria bacterium]
MAEKTTQLEVSRLLTKAVQMGAQVMHLQPGALPVIRISGELRSLQDEVIVTVEMVQSMFDFLALPIHKEHLERDRQVIFSTELDNHQRVILRAEWERGRLVVSVQFIHAKIHTFQELAVPPVVERIAQKESGLFIISGPFDSGKTSLWTSIIETINTNLTKRIVTIESPIEHVFVNKKSFIEQREIGRDVTSWAAGARGVKETDVDLLGVSDCTSGEQLKEIINVSEGKTLVIMIMESLSVVHALDILQGYFTAEEQSSWRAALARATEAIVNLRLLPRVGGGRVMAYEVYAKALTTQSLVSQGSFSQLPNAMHTASQEGMQTLDSALVALVRAGSVLPEHALAESQNPDQLKSMFGK